MNQLRVWWVAGVMALAAGVALAEAPAGVEFSAETYQVDAQNHQRSGRIFVGPQMIRNEMEQNGLKIVNIIDTRRQITWVLYPQQRSYMEYGLSNGETPAPDSQVGSPCENVPGASCKRLGEEDVNGRAAVKWSVSMPGPQGQIVSSTQWLGKERSILLRQAFPGGALMEQRMLGIEELNGRQVEKWEMQVTQPDQSPQISTRWFDPELNLAIKEASPGGYIRELRNIRIGKQDPALFQVPAGYQQIQPQQPR